MAYKKTAKKAVKKTRKAKKTTPPKTSKVPLIQVLSGFGATLTLGTPNGEAIHKNVKVRWGNGMRTAEGDYVASYLLKKGEVEFEFDCGDNMVLDATQAKNLKEVLDSVVGS